MNQEEAYIQQLQMQIQKEKLRNEQMQHSHSATIFNKESLDSENLVRYQLDIKEELVRIERLLRKLIPRYDQERGEWFEEPDEEDMLFNERGVNEILNLLSWYLNKNLILSNFDEDEIKIRMEQFSNELNNLIFNNYEDFGLNTKNKQKYYPIAVINIINIVEAAYHRALGGGERENIRTARTVTQSEPLGNMSMGFPQQRSKGIFGKIGGMFGGG